MADTLRSLAHPVLELAEWAPIVIACIMLSLTPGTRVRHFLSIVAQPMWLSNLALVALFSFYVFYLAPPSKKTLAMRDATRKGVLALIIVVISEAGLVVAPFWLMYIVTYFLGGWGE